MRILTSGGHVIVNFKNLITIRIVNEPSCYTIVADQALPGNGHGGNSIGMGHYKTYEEAKDILNAILTCEQSHYCMPPSTYEMK